MHVEPTASVASIDTGGGTRRTSAAVLQVENERVEDRERAFNDFAEFAKNNQQPVADGSGWSPYPSIPPPSYHEQAANALNSQPQQDEGFR